jgi:hypothetical protein
MTNLIVTNNSGWKLSYRCMIYILYFGDLDKIWIWNFIAAVDTHATSYLYLGKYFRVGGMAITENESTRYTFYMRQATWKPGIPGNSVKVSYWWFSSFSSMPYEPQVSESVRHPCATYVIESEAWRRERGKNKGVHNWGREMFSVAVATGDVLDQKRCFFLRNFTKSVNNH